MATSAHRGITVSLLVLSAAWSAASATAQQLEPAAARVPSLIEIDRSAISIDIAAQRRSVDSSIRRALESKASATPVEAPRLATAEARPRG
jgi:hypothetical protein